ncbi:hypothetical protein NJC38_26730 [Pseudomonas sp. 21LCFQ010]|uniref:XAC2610-related protein n=1 Tax=Pseudomonas sp. 21LCFQ010 TaxID=2957506 RepID=UPI0020985870|nr:hypothetical protein [Pseudomonas sp. 21LCFQ010]
MSVSIIQRLCLFTMTLLVPLLVSAASAPQIYGEMDADRFQEITRSTYNLQDFAEHYRATLEISAEDEVFRPGIIRIYNKQDGAELLQVRSDELVLNTDPKTGKVKANVHELPYGEQSVLIYDDFNFDGIKDLALMDGQFSCYHGPSYQVFLGTAEGFRRSEAFTELAQNYCGFFDYNAQTRRVSTMAKSGCCSHWFTTYRIDSGEPVIEVETAIDASGVAGLPRETRWREVDGKRVSTTRTLWDPAEEIQTLLAFRLAPSGKRIILFRWGDHSPVYYVAVDNNNEVGLVYPEAEPQAFDYDSVRQVLSFVRGDTTYRIVGDKRGKPNNMEVVIRGKTTELKLLAGPIEGSLKQVGQALQDAQ